ncbi:hypothetical protein VPG91_22600 [Nitrospirillum amazonense]|uniref:hypothetical protein n=1 Tax=Nitrospirillum amazonense TaxID=28077 RepID=UPI002DD44375|nr:hypothetical protein [Nitrospirillum amazonense]MEC4593808.1 hypothetical protein [Nitrospirillum amazonense]
MNEDLVMRSVYLRPSEDGQLRQLAHELNVTKSDLIRSAISVKLREWLLDSNSTELVMRDLEFGKRGSAAERVSRAPEATVAAPVATGRAQARSEVTAVPAASARGRRQQVVEG